MKRSPFEASTLDEIFKFDPGNAQRLSSRESGRLEFKETFHFGSIDDYAKTMAAFANTAGGYLVFGVKDKPRVLIGLKNDTFDNLDPARLTQTLSSTLAPEIHWEQHIHEVQGKKLGIFYIYESRIKPVVALKTTNEVQEGGIYYRYRGRSEKIKYSELRQLLDNEREKERELWTQTLRQMARIGIENVGVLDSATGEVSGGKGSFLIAQELLPQLQFIHSGTFVESEGQPVFKLIGDVVPVSTQLVQPTKYVRAPLHGVDILKAFLRRESILLPLDYVKQVCFEPSQFYPIHFFTNQTNVTASDVVAELEKMDCRAARKNKLIERFKTDETFTYGKLTSETPSTKRRLHVFDGLVAKTLNDVDAAGDLPALFHALTHLDRQNADPEYLLPLLLRVAMPKYSSISPLDAGFMRKAICHLDIVWYKQASAKATDELVSKAG